MVDSIVYLNGEVDVYQASIIKSIQPIIFNIPTIELILTSGIKKISGFINVDNNMSIICIHPTIENVKWYKNSRISFNNLWNNDSALNFNS